MSPPRVLRVIARMNVGGPARQVVELGRGLEARGFTQRLLIGSIGADEADHLALRAPDLPHQRIAGLGRAPSPLADIGALRAIASEIAAFGPDIVHTHTAKAGALGRVAAIGRRVPVRVHTFHGHLLHGYFRPPMTRAVVLAERALAARTTALVAVGARVRDELLAAGVGRAEQYTVVPPGVSLAPLPDIADARAALDLPAGAVVVTSIGRLVDVKRPDRFVAMAGVVAAAVPDAVFVVVGDGPARPATEAAAAGSAARFRFLGWRGDVETVLAASDVVVVTSDNEGTPVSLIEAGLAGRATVTTDVGSASEVVRDGETGFVTATDAGAVADAVTTLVRDPRLRADLGDAARAWTTGRFSAERLVDDTAALYESLLGR